MSKSGSGLPLGRNPCGGKRKVEPFWEEIKWLSTTLNPSLKEAAKAEAGLTALALGLYRCLLI